MSLEALDSFVVNRIAEREPVDFQFPVGGPDYRGTSGSRDSFKSLTSGGFIAENETMLLVAADQFAAVAGPVEESKIAVYVNSHGVPCVRDAADEEEPTQTMRVKRIGRAGGGLTYTLRSEAR